MLALEEALAQVLAAVPPAKPELVALNDADGRVLLEPVVAPRDLPGFDNSSVDGYAVRAEDVAIARLEAPVTLRLDGRVAAGDSAAGELGPGTCARLFTGAALPRGANAVVMQEDTHPELESVQVLDAVQPWENVRFRGEDVKQGAVLAAAGERLTPGQVALLAALGMARMPVGAAPVVGLLATGSELREAGTPLAPGQTYECNRPALAGLLRRAGAQPRLFPLVPDTLAATRSALETALDQCDAVVTSGGVSVGELDFVKDALRDLGGEVAFWRVAIKPGRPFVFGRCRGKLLFGLPGNPVSAFVTFLLLVRPALLRWQGARDVDLPVQDGPLAEPLQNAGDRRHFVRVRLDGAGCVYSAGGQGSHRLGSLAAAHGLVELAPASWLAAGTRVRVLRFA